MTKKHTSFHSQISCNVIIFGWSYNNSISILTNLGYDVTYQHFQYNDFIFEGHIIFDSLFLYSFDCIFFSYTKYLQSIILFSLFSTCYAMPYIYACVSVYHNALTTVYVGSWIMDQVSRSHNFLHALNSNTFRSCRPFCQHGTPCVLH